MADIYRDSSNIGELPPHTAKLAEVAIETRYEDLSASTLHAAKRLILDTVACAVGGFATDAGKAVTRVKRAQGGTPEATMLVSGVRTSAASAAYVNSSLAAQLDADDTYAWSGHHGNAAVMGALAVAESTGVEGREFIASVAVGFEIAARIGRSLLATVEDTGSSGIRIKANAGLNWLVFGPAVAAARMMGLDSTQMAHVFGAAAASTSLPIGGQWSFWTSNRPMTKWAFPGPMADVAVSSALLVKEGFLADPRVFDHPRGYWCMTGASGHDPACYDPEPGRPWAVEETSLKPYPACRFTNGPLDTLLRLICDHRVSAGEIERIDVYVCGRAMAFAGHGLGNQVDAAFNFPHLFAVAALGEPPGPRWHLRTHDPVVVELSRRVHVHPYPKADATIAEQLKRGQGNRTVPHLVEIHTPRGRFSAEAELSRGDPWSEETRLSDEDIVRKFQTFSSGLLSTSAMDAACQEAFALESAPSVARFVSLLA